MLGKMEKSLRCLRNSMLAYLFVGLLAVLGLLAKGDRKLLHPMSGVGRPRNAGGEVEKMCRILSDVMDEESADSIRENDYFFLICSPRKWGIGKYQYKKPNNHIGTLLPIPTSISSAIT